MKEYFFEDREVVDIDDLKSEKMPKEDYIKAHKSLVIFCHDIFIEYNDGILLVIRKEFPAKGILWPIGGRVLRGYSVEDSLRLKVKEECGLEIEDIKGLGCARTFFKTDPFGHGKGTDSINFVYFAKGKGELRLDELHEKPMIVSKEKYKEIRDDLHPYIRDFMDKVIEMF
ncbi:MAG: NUDIX domain-containing protein [archaeon]